MNSLKDYNNIIENYYMNQEINFLREIELNLLSHLILKNEDIDKIIEINNSNDNSTITGTCNQRGKSTITLPIPTCNNQLNSIIQDTLVYKDDYLTDEKIIIISEKNNSFIEEYFKFCIQEEINCIYAISGQLGKDIMYKDNEIKKIVSKITNNNYKSAFTYDKATNTFAKIYILRK